MGQRTYPNNEKECAKQLQRRLMSTTPAAFLDRIEKREETKDMLDMGKKLTWGEIVVLAEKEDKKRRKAAFYRQSDDSDPELLNRLQRLKCSTSAAVVRNSPDKIFTNSQYSGAPARQSNTFISCQWCGKPGHLEEKCWMKKGVCTICGGADHKRVECPKTSKLRASSAFNRATCSICGGSHLGKDCPGKQGRSLESPSKAEALNC